MIVLRRPVRGEKIRILLPLFTKYVRELELFTTCLHTLVAAERYAQILATLGVRALAIGPRGACKSTPDVSVVRKVTVRRYLIVFIYLGVFQTNR